LPEGDIPFFNEPESISWQMSKRHKMLYERGSDSLDERQLPNAFTNSQDQVANNHRTTET
jgi:hypothetical protein